MNDIFCGVFDVIFRYICVRIMIIEYTISYVYEILNQI